MQQGWKACPACGDRVDSGQDASLNIADSTVKEVNKELSTFQPLQTRATLTFVLLGCFGILAVASVLLTLSDIELLQKMKDGYPVSDDEIEYNDSRMATLVLIFYGTFIATAIAFCTWIYRASEKRQHNILTLAPTRDMLPLTSGGDAWT